jgi:hypothetical protein
MKTMLPAFYAMSTPKDTHTRIMANQGCYSTRREPGCAAMKDRLSRRIERVEILR